MTYAYFSTETSIRQSPCGAIPALQKSRDVEELMKHSNRFNTRMASNYWALALFCLSMSLTALAKANGHALQCHNVFAVNSDMLIAMNPLYRGEDKGTYMDPITKKPWNVKYFSKEELLPYALFAKDGLIVNHQGKKTSSDFDPEAMSFEHGLLVIDKNNKAYLLPFESRGKYHHSSLSAGDDIIFAGTATFHNGVLREFSNSSGHYKPSSKQTLKALKILQKQGVNLDSTKLTGPAAKELTNSYSIDPKELSALLKKLE